MTRSFAAGLRSEVSIRRGSTGALDTTFSERRANDGDVRALQRQLLGYEVAVNAPTSKSPEHTPLPSRLAQICASAKGDTAIVCAEYAALHEQVERDRAAARKRIDEQTRGGVVDVLR